MPQFRLPIALAATALLVGCAGPGGESPAVRSMPEPTSTPASAAVAVSVDNCGFPLVVDSAPQRIVAIKSSAAELLLALGLEDRMVGAAFLDGPLDPGHGDDGAQVAVISEGLPGQESVLALEPDAVFGGWESTFSADGVGRREDLDALGIATYVAPSACKDPDSMPRPMTFALLMDHVREAGEVFGTSDEAADLVRDLESSLEAIAPDERHLSAVWYSSGVDTPYVGAGVGAPQMIMAGAGLSNIAADVEDTWSSMSWEAVAAADPDVMVLVDSAWNTADSKIETLEDHPATAQLAAVRESRYVIIPFAASEAGVRSVDAVASIVDQLGELAFDG